jgi:hypothetical protein
MNDFGDLFWWCAGLLAGFGLANWFNHSMWRIDSVRRGFAEYDSQTGKWQWKE